MSIKICVYAICKNEYKMINRWLESMSEADYIVVLDTGSTDGTFEALQQDKRIIKVEQQIINPWRFDVARNESMKLVPEDTDILVCTDFDEIFEPGWAAFLRNNWQPDYHTRCFYSYAWAHGSIGEPQFVFKYDKIHTRDYHWVFPVHEVLYPNNDDFVENKLEADNNIFLHHYQDQSKKRNYMDLLALSVKENPDESHVKFLYAREFVNDGKYEEALKLLFDTLNTANIETPEREPVLLSTIYYIAYCYYYLKNYDETIWYCNEFIRVNNSYREPYLLMSRAFIETKVFTIAESCVLAALKYSTYKKDWVETAASWSYEPDLILGAIYLNMQNYDEAIKHLREALKYIPDNIEVLQQYAAALEQKIAQLSNN